MYVEMLLLLSLLLEQHYYCWFYIYFFYFYFYFLFIYFFLFLFLFYVFYPWFLFSFWIFFSYFYVASQYRKWLSVAQGQGREQGERLNTSLCTGHPTKHSWREYPDRFQSQTYRFLLFVSFPFLLHQNYEILFTLFLEERHFDLGIFQLNWHGLYFLPSLVNLEQTILQLVSGVAQLFLLVIQKPSIGDEQRNTRTR